MYKGDHGCFLLAYPQDHAFDARPGTCYVQRGWADAFRDGEDPSCWQTMAVLLQEMARGTEVRGELVT